MAYSTKWALADALKELLAKKPLDQIKVTELVEIANVNRQTFYYNFQDIYALVEWVFREEGKRVIGENYDHAHWKQALKDYFNYMQENRVPLINAFCSYSRSALEKYIKESVFPLVDSVVRSQIEGKNLSEDDTKFLVKIYVLTLVELFFQWMEFKKDSKYEEDINRLIKLIDGSADIFARKLKD